MDYNNNCAFNLFNMQFNFYIKLKLFYKRAI